MRSGITAPWQLFGLACPLLSGITEQVDENKLIPLSPLGSPPRSRLLRRVVFGVEERDDDGRIHRGLWCRRRVCLRAPPFFCVSRHYPPLPPSISHFLPSLLTNAVGLQRAELEPWLAEAGVAGLHRNTSPRATYGGGIGTLVNTYKKPQRYARS